MIMYEWQTEFLFQQTHSDNFGCRHYNLKILLVNYSGYKTENLHLHYNEEELLEIK